MKYHNGFKEVDERYEAIYSTELEGFNARFHPWAIADYKESKIIERYTTEKEAKEREISLNKTEKEIIEIEEEEVKEYNEIIDRAENDWITDSSRSIIEED
jgi:hypothetical protein